MNSETDNGPRVRAADVEDHLTQSLGRESKLNPSLRTNTRPTWSGPRLPSPRHWAFVFRVGADKPSSVILPSVIDCGASTRVGASFRWQLAYTILPVASRGSAASCCANAGKHLSGVIGPEKVNKILTYKLNLAIPKK